MTSKLTREKAQWLHDACEEAAAAGIKLTMNPNELLMFTSYALAAMDSEPVAWRWRRGPDTRWHLASSGDLAGEVEPLYRHAQQSVVPDAYVHDEHGRMMLNDICEPKIGFGAGWSACRAAMLSGGKS